MIMTEKLLLFGKQSKQPVDHGPGEVIIYPEYIPCRWQPIDRVMTASEQILFVQTHHRRRT